MLSAVACPWLMMPYRVIVALAREAAPHRKPILVRQRIDAAFETANHVD